MPKHQHPDIPGAQRLLYWLSQAASDARQQAGAGRGLVSDLYQVSGRTIERFEEAAHFPSDPDWLMAAYAKAIGLDDPRDIYRRALENWYKDKSGPFRLDGVTRAERFDLAPPARQEAADEHERKTTSTPKRRATS